jgi:hypothetical protein
MGAFDFFEVTNDMMAKDLSMQVKATKKAPMGEERLPFTVKAVRNEPDLMKAVHIRQTAYGRHVPELAELLRLPELYDREDGSVVLLAESKLDGSAVGTMRIQTNRYRKLGLEDSVVLPAWLQHKNLAEATRLGVSGGRIGRLPKTMLFKAYFDYCVDEDIDWMVITARSPLDRQYEALLFKDVFPGGAFIPMHHVGHIPHRVMAFEVAAAENIWAAAHHPLFDFMFRTYHPDIDVNGEDFNLPNNRMRQPQFSNRIGTRQ